MTERLSNNQLPSALFVEFVPDTKENLAGKASNFMLKPLRMGLGYTICDPYKYTVTHIIKSWAALFFAVTLWVPFTLLGLVLDQFSNHQKTYDRVKKYLASCVARGEGLDLESREMRPSRTSNANLNAIPPQDFSYDRLTRNRTNPKFDLAPDSNSEQNQNVDTTFSEFERRNEVPPSKIGQRTDDVSTPFFRRDPEADKPKPDARTEPRFKMFQEPQSPRTQKVRDAEVHPETIANPGLPPSIASVVSEFVGNYDGGDNLNPPKPSVDDVSTKPPASAVAVEQPPKPFETKMLRLGREIPQTILDSFVDTKGDKELILGDMSLLSFEALKPLRYILQKCEGQDSITIDFKNMVECSLEFLADLSQDELKTFLKLIKPDEYMLKHLLQGWINNFINSLSKELVDNPKSHNEKYVQNLMFLIIKSLESKEMLSWLLNGIEKMKVPQIYQVMPLLVPHMNVDRLVEFMRSMSPKIFLRSRSDELSAIILAMASSLKNGESIWAVFDNIHHYYHGPKAVSGEFLSLLSDAQFTALCQIVYVEKYKDVLESLPLHPFKVFDQRIQIILKEGCSKKADFKIEGDLIENYQIWKLVKELRDNPDLSLTSRYFSESFLENFVLVCDPTQLVPVFKSLIFNSAYARYQNGKDASSILLPIVKAKDLEKMKAIFPTFWANYQWFESSCIVGIFAQLSTKEQLLTMLQAIPKDHKDRKSILTDILVGVGTTGYRKCHLKQELIDLTKTDPDLASYITETK